VACTVEATAYKLLRLQAARRCSQPAQCQAPCVLFLLLLTVDSIEAVLLPDKFHTHGNIKQGPGGWRVAALVQKLGLLERVSFLVFAMLPMLRIHYGSSLAIRWYDSPCCL
jgi:hypothetical protein